jgi:hypothetical protein
MEAFLASKLFKFGWPVVAVLIVIALGFGLVKTVSHWEKTNYDKGYLAGKNDTEIAVLKASAANTKAQMEQAAAQTLNSNNAVTAYLDDIANRKPEVVRAHDKETIYVNSPAGSAACLNPDGVSVWRSTRAASGVDASPNSSAPHPGRVLGSVPVAP